VCLADATKRLEQPAFRKLSLECDSIIGYLPSKNLNLEAATIRPMLQDIIHLVQVA